MKFKVLKLSILSCSYFLTLPVSAEPLDTQTATERLEQLSHAVAQGSYSLKSNEVDSDKSDSNQQNAAPLLTSRKESARKYEIKPSTYYYEKKLHITPTSNHQLGLLIAIKRNLTT